MISMNQDNVNNDIKNKGKLYLCATPIGNLEDITLRALRILKEVDVIAAEDTRHTRKLLSFYDIHTPITSYHEHNEREKGRQLIADIKSGKTVAVVSDAGTPGISDPGYELVAMAVKEGITVIPVPGASAAIAALAASGLSTDRFIFEGFLPRSGKDRNTALKKILSDERTVIFYESPYRVVKTLSEILDLGGNRKVVVTRELTKVYEQFIRGSISEVLEHFNKHKPKGEFTIILEGKSEETELEPVTTIDIGNYVQRLVGEGLDKKTAIKSAAQSLGISKREVYSAVLQMDPE